MTVARTKQQDVHVKADTRILHIETHLGLINITLGLTDAQGHSVESVHITADHYAGDPAVTIDGWPYVYHQGTRLVQETEAEQHAREGRAKDEHNAQPHTN